MNVQHLSADAQSVVKGTQAAVHGVTVIEFAREGDHPVALGERTEVDFYPGTIYMIKTGVCIEGVTAPHQLMVRPTLAAFKSGIEVVRHEVAAADGELVVFISSFTRLRFNRMTPMFEVTKLADSAMPVHAVQPVLTPEAGFGFDTKPKAPEKLVAFKGNERPGIAGQMQVQPVGEAKKVEDWMNSADVQTSQVGQATDTRPPLPVVKDAGEALRQGPAEMKV